MVDPSCFLRKRRGDGGHLERAAYCDYRPANLVPATGPKVSTIILLYMGAVLAVAGAILAALH